MLLYNNPFFAKLIKVYYVLDQTVFG